jgi:ribosomal protein S18 acetylase RimI-like enzyme
MKQVESFNQFNRLIKTHQEKYKNQVTNCFLFPNEIEKIITRGQLFFAEEENGVFFFRKRPGCHSLYYYWNPDNLNFESFSSYYEKPIVLDLTHIINREPGNLQSIKQAWERQGFLFYKKYQQMCLFQKKESDKQSINPIRNKGNNQFIVENANINDEDIISNLWRDSLDIFSAVLPSAEELKEKILLHQIFVCRNSDLNVIAALQTEKTGKTISIDHVVVNKDYRNKGLGDKLLATTLYNFIDVKKFVLWVDVNNLPAIHLYKKWGFAFSNKVSDQLILKNI